MDISINKSVARSIVQSNIARKPIDAELDGKAISARLGDISSARKMQLAGVLDTVDGAELLVALDSGSSAPISNKSALTVAGVRYDIIDVQPALGQDCYILTISKAI